ncbi:protease inhibitor I42 family protein [Vibrio sp. ZSDZ65]|uniref:Protease inhibitor I42 family protein n=1 Tax=Vibrio qingdaonensis TaxID=2829491 RepID=A0A9X3HVK4_9VIBR|nr:protease inhibitor I42 family protein [Vibrio qingdaonensis]MCW8345411.1 protease inhibitor I42 family protein [Vibrio qingdaonensis]
MSNANIVSDCMVKQVGEVVEVTLHGNITTGYDWYLKSKPDALWLSSAVYTTDLHAPGIVGAPGKRTFTFLAKEACTNEYLEFAYMRPWEKAPVQTTRYEVTVSQGEAALANA